MTFLICCTNIWSCLAQKDPYAASNMAGVGISQPLFNSYMRIDFQHSLASRWTVGGGVMAWLPKADARSDAGKLHDEILGTDSRNDEINDERNVHSSVMYLSYWPQRNFHGSFISIGCVHDENKGIGCRISFGFLMEIHKGFAISLRYERDLEGSQTDNMLHENLNLNLNYIF